MRRTAGRGDEPRLSRKSLRPAPPCRDSSDRGCPRTSGRSDSPPMAAVLAPPSLRYPLMLGWPRLRIMLLVAFAFAVVPLGDSPTPIHVWFARNLTVAMFATIAFGVFERWPETL